MDATFWIGVIVTTVLAVPAGILAIAIHSRIVRYLDSLKITSDAKRAETARRFYKIVQDLHTGRRDRYIYMLRGLLVTVTSYIVGTAAFFVVGAIIALIPMPSSQWLPATGAEWKSFVVMLILLFVGLLYLFVGTLSIRRWFELARALENFDAYEREFISRWGEPPNMTKNLEI